MLVKKVESGAENRIIESTAGCKNDDVNWRINDEEYRIVDRPQKGDNRGPR
jgi:hypothetical protein